MSVNKNKGDEVRPKVQWTAEDRARHQAVRDMFRNWQPSPEELIASGEGSIFDLDVECRDLRPIDSASQSNGRSCALAASRPRVAPHARLRWPG
jgi:hypothetical protein